MTPRESLHSVALRGGPVPIADVLAALPAEFERRAAELERYAPPAAIAFRECAEMVRAALRQAAEELLTLDQAADASGYSAEHLRHLVAEGRIPNAGKRGAPRVRRGDLPKKPRASAAAGYDPMADALALHTKTTRRAS